MWLIDKVKIHLPKLGYMDTKWANLNAPGLYTLAVVQFWVHLWASLSLHAGKGKCCIWLMDKVEIFLAKVSFVDCK